MAPSVSNVQNAIEHIYPKVQSFAKARTQQEIERMQILKGKIPSPASSDDEEEESFSDFGECDDF
ncbi:hypothetical protein SK128_001134 [Halocaridina rubra]|uniref:Uncharacterized protein n=1 Tax=Halocaridina rubra TaxID=373956 RepID=A0AAN9A3E4_HALRR